MNNYQEVLKNYQSWYIDLKDPKKFEKKRLDFLEYHQKNGITRVQIEPTQRCNFSCHMCPIDEISPQKAKNDLSIEDFRYIIDTLPKSVATVCMSGLGEPFLNKDYIDMLSYAKKKQLSTEVYNNGSLFNEDILKYTDSICFSVDALSKDLIQDLRKGVKYDKLFEAIKRSIIYRDKINPNLKVIINFTISNKNYQEIPLLFEACETLRVNEIYIQAVSNNYSVNSTKYKDFSKFIKENSFDNWEYILKQYNEKYNFTLTIWYPRKLKGFCNWLFSSLYITKDLNLISCCHKVTEPLIFGNVKQNSFENILKSDKVLAFKDAHLKNKSLALCNNCPF